MCFLRGIYYLAGHLSHYFTYYNCRVPNYQDYKIRCASPKYKRLKSKTKQKWVGFVDTEGQELTNNNLFTCLKQNKQTTLELCSSPPWFIFCDCYMLSRQESTSLQFSGDIKSPQLHRECVLVFLTLNVFKCPYAKMSLFGDLGVGSS